MSVFYATDWNTSHAHWGGRAAPMRVLGALSELLWAVLACELFALGSMALYLGLPGTVDGQ